MSEQFTPQEQFLVERLRRAPQPELSRASLESIRLRVLDAMDVPPTPAPHPTLPITTIAIALIVVVVAAIIAVVLLQQNTTETNPTPAAVTASPLVLPSATVQPTETLTPSPTATPSPTTAATATIDTVTVIQGIVEAVDGNVITIFGVEVQIEADDPALNTIQVGDVVRIEGNTQTTENGLIVLAVTITFVNVEVNVDAPPGQVWRDDGSCLNPPPDWAPAHGWRQRCQGVEKDKPNNGRGQGNDDDDDD